MNDSISPRLADALTLDLQEFASICEEVLSLAKCEHLALSGQSDYKPLDFYEKRKTLLPNIEGMLAKFRRYRTVWLQISQSQREQFKNLKQQFHNIQGLMMRVILLDRENQQTMLKRGLVPASQVPAAAAQRPHYVADLYKRNSAD